jgi:hypothetical protein
MINQSYSTNEHIHSEYHKPSHLKFKPIIFASKKKINYIVNISQRQIALNVPSLNDLPEFSCKHLFNATISMYIDMQFIIAVYLVQRRDGERERSGLILFMTQLRELMRGMGFLENYCGSERK